MSTDADSPNIEEILRGRATRLFDYLKAISALRQPPVREVRSHNDRAWWQASLPDFSTVRVRPTESTWLVVSKTEPADPPEIPEDLEEFIDGTDLRIEPTLRRDSLADLEPESLLEIEVSLRDFIDDEWRPWADETREAMRAKDLYDDLFELRRRLDREEAQLQLVWGHGIILWRSGNVPIRYPLITTECRVEFDTLTGDISVSSIGGPHMEIDVFQGVSKSYDLLTDIRNRFRTEPPDQWNDDETEALYQRVVNSLGAGGETTSALPDDTLPAQPRISKSWVFMVRQRPVMFMKFFEEARAAIENGQQIPIPIASIVADEPSILPDLMGGGDSASWTHTADRLLMPLPTNIEQADIATRLAEHSGVTVQGPPGTGKTHTIANLIAHLVANGKRVLVTAHKEQPLVVLRDKLPEEIRDLCVSVTGNSAGQLSQLEQSLQAITENASALDQARARSTIQQQSDSLDQKLRELAALRSKQAAVIESESRTFHLEGRDVYPRELAAWLRDHESDFTQIPDALALNTRCPLSADDYARLLTLESRLEPQDRRHAAQPLPDPHTLPDQHTLKTLLSSHEDLEREANKHASRFTDWSAVDKLSTDEIREIQKDLEDDRATLELIEGTWLGEVADDIERDSADRWAKANDALCELLEAVTAHRTAIARNSVKLPTDELPTREFIEQLRQLRQSFENGRRGPGLGSPKLRKLRDRVTIDGERPLSTDDVDLAIAAAELERSRHELRNLWNNECGRVGAPAIDDPAPESKIRELQLQLNTTIEWSTKDWAEMKADLEDLGLKPPSRPTLADIENLKQAADGALTRLKCLEANEKITSIRRDLDHGAEKSQSTLWKDLSSALDQKDDAKWEAARNECGRLRKLIPDAEELEGLHARLKKVAPLWSQELSATRGADAVDPTRLEQAWKWRIAESWLRDLLAEGDIGDIGSAIENTTEDIRRVTESLTTQSAWLAVSESLDDKRRHSLQAWAQSLKKIGKGTGKYAGKWRAEAHKSMRDAQTAVPVWIMPIYRAVESFSPGSDAFDVVIVDESSQCDLYSLAVLTLAKKAVIVGDDKQISPQAVGIDQAKITELLDEHIPDLPSARLLDPTSSLYDISRRSYPGTVLLREHFRCVPEIIQFSNDLSYNGEILPLREDIAIANWSPLVSEYVADGYRDENDCNPVEAERIADKIEELVAHPVYAGKTMGIITLLGANQAGYIQKLLVKRIGEAEIEARQIHCGDAYFFQGDERDIMFLSLVAARTGPNGSEQRQYAFTKASDQQRINVAASRARDQMWVFHSIDSDDLLAEDFRGRLLRYVKDPKRVVREYGELEDLCDSPFEREVLRQLIAREYLVTPQFRVGKFRIDFVIEGIKTRLALECDGEAYHGADQFENDQRRQETLERLGWKFVRIRGSAFYRDPQAALEPLWRRLDEMGIQPGARGPKAVTITTQELAAPDDMDVSEPTAAPEGLNADQPSGMPRTSVQRESTPSGLSETSALDTQSKSTVDEFGEMAETSEVHLGAAPDNDEAGAPAGEVADAGDEYVRPVRVSPEQLREHRTRRGLTQAQVAEAMGVTQPVISLWERGQAAPSERDIERLIAFLTQLEALPSTAPRRTMSTERPFRGPHAEFLRDMQANRKRLGLSQEQLGRKIGVSQGQVSRWETARDQPTKSQLKRLKEILKAVDDTSTIASTLSPTEDSTDDSKRMDSKPIASEPVPRPSLPGPPWGDIQIGSLPMLISQLVILEGKIPQTHLEARFATYYEVNLPEDLSSLFGRFTWSAKGRGFIDLNSAGAWVEGKTAPSHIAFFGEWTLAGIIEEASQLLTAQTDDIYPRLTATVFGNTTGNVPEIAKSVLSAAVKEARRAVDP